MCLLLVVYRCVYRAVAVPRKRDSGDGALYAIRGGKLWRAVIDDGFHRTADVNSESLRRRQRKALAASSTP